MPELRFRSRRSKVHALLQLVQKRDRLSPICVVREREHIRVLERQKFA